MHFVLHTTLRTNGSYFLKAGTFSVSVPTFIVPMGKWDFHFKGRGGPIEPPNTWGWEGKGLIAPGGGGWLFGAIYGKGVVLLFGFVLSWRARPWVYLFGTAKGHNGPRAISKIMNRVSIVLCS